MKKYIHEIVETERLINYFIWEPNPNCISGYSRNENSFTIFKKDYCWINEQRMKKFFKKKVQKLTKQLNNEYKLQKGE